MSKPPIRIGAAIPVLNEWRFLPAVAGQLLAVVDRVVLLRGLISLSGAPIAYQLIPELDPRIEILEGEWRGEAATRNAGIEYLEDCEYVIGIDTDEVFTEQGLREIAHVCRSERPEIVSVPLHTYWKTPQHRIAPPEPGMIPLVLRSDLRYDGLRGARGRVRRVEVGCHHLSYVRTDQELLDKLATWGHARDVIPGWYENVWKAWDRNPALRNLHPVHPAAYAQAVETSDRELLEILEKWGCR